MVTAVLTMAFTWCLLYGSLAQPLLIAVCVVSGAFFADFSRHKPDRELSVDALAQTSRLRHVSPALKFLTLLALIIICVASRSLLAGVFLVFAALVLAAPVGGLGLRRFVHVLTLPVSFLLIGGLALLIEVSPGPIGVFNINVLGAFLSVTAASQARAALIVSRALGAVSCLSLLSVTTPMPDIIGVLRRFRCPSLIIDLMYLIYRYIFILLSLHHEMHNAVRSRLGFRDLRTSIRATGMIYANLLARSYQFASKNFDAMESRCYDTGIRFLERRAGVAPVHMGVAAALLLASLCISMLR